MRIFKTKKIWIVLISAVIIGAIVFRSREDGEFSESSVQRGDVAEELILSGQVVADEHARLTFPTSGKIMWINVSEGQSVTKGQYLAKLDSLVLNSTLQRARADLRAAEANLEEVYDDVKGSSSDETFVEKNARTAAEAAKDKAYEAVLIAEENLKSATLVAPFGGLVTQIANPFSGINVQATQTQVEIVNPDTIHFEVLADQVEVISISEGGSVTILLDAILDKEFSGQVSHISYTPKEGEVGTVYSIKILFDNLENSKLVYRIGMTGDVRFLLSKKENALFIPSDYIKSDKEGQYVLTDNGKTKVRVETGIEGEDRTEILSGIKEGVKIYD